MAPSHSKPEQVLATMNHIITLIDSIDNKVLIATHDYLATAVRKEPNAGYETYYAMLDHIFALKVHLQTQRRNLK